MKRRAFRDLRALYLAQIKRARCLLLGSHAPVRYVNAFPIICRDCGATITRRHA